MIQHLDPDLLRTFLAIVDTRSFTRAASRIGRTPSAISMQVKKLEEIVGRRLFERDARTVTPTPHAESVVPEARRLLERSATLLARMRAPNLEGSISIGIPDDYASVFMPPILSRFARSHPALQVEVQCFGSRELIARLLAGTLDATLATAGDVVPSEGLRIEPLHEEPMVWLGAVGGHAHEERPLPLAASSPSCSWRKQAQSALDAAGIEHRTAYTSPLSTGQLAAVAADLAVAPLPACLAGGAVERVPAEAGLPDLPPTAMVFVRRDESDPRIEALGSHTLDLFGECCGQARMAA